MKEIDVCLFLNTAAEAAGRRLKNWCLGRKFRPAPPVILRKQKSCFPVALAIAAQVEAMLPPRLRVFLPGAARDALAATAQAADTESAALFRIFRPFAWSGLALKVVKPLGAHF